MIGLLLGHCDITLDSVAAWFFSRLTLIAPKSCARLVKFAGISPLYTVASSAGKFVKLALMGNYIQLFIIFSCPIHPRQQHTDDAIKAIVNPTATVLERISDRLASEARISPAMMLGQVMQSHDDWQSTALTIKPREMVRRPSTNIFAHLMSVIKDST
jgi:hypothetical protein